MKTPYLITKREYSKRYNVGLETIEARITSGELTEVKGKIKIMPK